MSEPIATILLAHAEPSCCFDAGNTSTIKLLVLACTALIAKSTPYMLKTANEIAIGRLLLSSSTKMLRNSVVHPSKRSERLTTIVPTAINGLLRPYFDVERSANMPTIGCIIRPESGPAIQTRETCDLVRPRFNRYGVQYPISIPQVNLLSQVSNRITW